MAPPPILCVSTLVPSPEEKGVGAAIPIALAVVSLDSLQVIVLRVSLVASSTASPTPQLPSGYQSDSLRP